MNTLLLFLALPISTIILSIVLLKILKCPALVAATFFAIYLILTYSLFGTDFLIFAIIYTVLSYITTVITKTICNIIVRINRCSNNNHRECQNNNKCGNNFCDCLGYNISTTNNFDTGNSITNANNSNNYNNGRCLPRAQFTVSTNQENPVLFLSNKNTNCGRQNCCGCRRK